MFELTFLFSKEEHSNFPFSNLAFYAIVNFTPFHYV